MAKDTNTSQDKLIDILNRFGRVFRRLEIYTGISPTEAMMTKIVEIMIEVVNILAKLAIATKEVNHGRFSGLQ